MFLFFLVLGINLFFYLVNFLSVQHFLKHDEFIRYKYMFDQILNCGAFNFCLHLYLAFYCGQFYPDSR